MASRSRRPKLLRLPKEWKWPKVPAARRYHDDYVRALIVADLIELGGRGSWEDFERLHPGRYNRRYFNATMKQLAKTPVSVQYAGRSRMFGAHIWQLPSYEDPRQEEDRCQPSTPDHPEPTSG